MAEKPKEPAKEKEKPGGADAITVCVRIRPHDSNRDGDCDGPSFDLQGNVIMENTATGKKAYTYDWVGHPSTMNSPTLAADGTVLNPGMYKSTSERVVLAAMEGYNGTVFTYGQTGSGKTHSMMGTPEDPGIIRGSVISVFSYIDEHPTHEFLLRVSYIEVYNEEINDLLNFDTGLFVMPRALVLELTVGFISSSFCRSGSGDQPQDSEGLSSEGCGNCGPDGGDCGGCAAVGGCGGARGGQSALCLHPDERT
jgi:hypothetical protein